jgi:hypothetical protein
LEDMELDVTHSLTQSIRNLDANYNLAQTHYNRLAAAQNDVEASQVAYEESVSSQQRGGRDPLDALLDATRRRSQALQAFYQAIIEYNKAIADIHMKKGSILEYCGIEFEEGPWSRKAYWDALARARERDASKYMDYGWTRPNVASIGPTENLGVPLVDGTDPTAPDALPDELPEESVEELPTPADSPALDAAPMERLPNELGPEAKRTSPKNVSGGANRLRTAQRSASRPSVDDDQPDRVRDSVAVQEHRVASPVRAAAYHESESDTTHEAESARPYHPAPRTAARRTSP